MSLSLLAGRTVASHFSSISAAYSGMKSTALTYVFLLCLVFTIDASLKGRVNRLGNKLQKGYEKFIECCRKMCGISNCDWAPLNLCKCKRQPSKRRNQQTFNQPKNKW